MIQYYVVKLGCAGRLPCLDKPYKYSATAVNQSRKLNRLHQVVNSTHLAPWVVIDSNGLTVIPSPL